MADKCPVDHGALAPSADKCPVDHGSISSSADKCPVDHEQRSTWASLLPSSSKSAPAQPQQHAPGILPRDREISSIPRVDGSKWVYPSQAQFYAAMARKNHNPQASDMQVIVPIHNAVNERAWMEVMKWEASQGGEQCGGVKLVSFKGRPKDLTPKARLKTFLGYSAPFDRHDWIVERCGKQIRYVIDFYTGHSNRPGSNLSFYLDARPALDNWDGVRMRAERFWERWAGKLWSNGATSTDSASPRS
ncbi:hypothetical protein FOMPIDRAFT_1039250 [Fomitopsis schrenkii]|uniref:Holocytochrome c-type synthase n=1 Tax=Fomitopsis schrenkii TaxID=2126942 RepID=S8EP90_FOMSC|nr:hypothetical protein FOMPIDRAFT_1039250 [Fomitopsis schrenkii]